MKTTVIRLLHMLGLLAGAYLLTFILFNLSPGDPSNQYFGPRVKKKNITALGAKMGTEQAWHESFLFWLNKLMQGDLGYSWSMHRPVKAVLAEAVPATLQLSSISLLTSLILGCTFGLIGGLWSKSFVGSLIDYFSLSIYSTPSFLLALILIFIFAIKLQWLPAYGASSLFAENLGFWQKITDQVKHLLLPVSVLSLAGASSTSRFVKARTEEILRQDYILMAFAKGLPKSSIYLKHVLKNSLLPVVTLLGVYFPFLLGGAFIVEIIFAWPGMGRVTYNAIFSKDLPLLMAINLVVATMVVLGNLIADLLYRFVDPRIEV